MLYLVRAVHTHRSLPTKDYWRLSFQQTPASIALYPPGLCRFNPPVSREAALSNPNLSYNPSRLVLTRSNHNRSHNRADFREVIISNLNCSHSQPAFREVTYSSLDFSLHLCRANPPRVSSHRSVGIAATKTSLVDPLVSATLVSNQVCSPHISLA